MMYEKIKVFQDNYIYFDFSDNHIKKKDLSKEQICENKKSKKSKKFKFNFIAKIS